MLISNLQFLTFFDLSNPGTASASLLPYAAAVIWCAARHAALLGLQCLAGIAREDSVVLRAWCIAGTLAPSVRDLVMIIIILMGPRCLFYHKPCCTM